MRMHLTSLLCTLLAFELTAADAQIRDFSAGFEKLCELAGIADLSEAEPGRIRWTESPATTQRLEMLSPPVGDDAMASWRLGGNPDGSARVLLGGMYLLSLYRAEEVDASRLCGTWQRQSVKTLFRRLKSDVQSWVEMDQDEPSVGDAGPDLTSGGLLLSATFLFAAGRHDEANQLAGMLLSGQRTGRVIAGAYYLAADGRYRTAFLELMATGDRIAFANALQSLGENFPTGWPGLAGVKHMLAKLRTPGPTPGAVAALPEEDRKLVAQLMSGNSFGTLPEATGWLLFSPKDLPRKERDGTLARLLRKGVDALPILFALAEDSRLTVWAVEPDPERMQMMLLVAAQREQADEDVTGEPDPETAGEWACAGLPRLLTGRQFASRLLAQMRHPPNPEWHEGREDELLEDVREWYTAHKGLSRPALARKMLAEREGRVAALLYLLSLPLSEDDFLGIEAAMLKLTPEECFDPLALLMELRGEKARALVERAIRKASSRGGDQGWTAEVLRGLLPERRGGKVSSVPAFRASLDKALVDDSLGLLWPLMKAARQFAGNADLAGEILERAAESKIQKHRQILMAILEVVANRDKREGAGHSDLPPTWEELARKPNPADAAGRGDGTEKRRGLLKLDLARYGPAWRKLLPPGPDDSPLAERAGTRDHAEGFFRRMYGADGPNGSWNESERVLRLLPGGVDKQVWRRCQTLLDRPGGKMPPWPDPNSVATERVDEIVAALAKLSKTAARHHILALPDDEHLALLLALPDHEDLASRLLLEQRGVLPACRFIWGAPPGPLKDALAPFAGRKLSKQVGEELLAAAQNVMEEGQSFIAYFQAGPGLNISFEATALDATAKEGTAMAKLLEQVTYLVPVGRGPGVHVYLATGASWCGFWPAETGKQGGALDQMLPGAEGNETEGLFGGEGMAGDMFARTAAPEELPRFFKALGTLPKRVLLTPQESISLMVVALDKATDQRLKKGRSQPPGRSSDD